MESVNRNAHITSPEGDAKHILVLFDGVCNLCHASVRFIIARDPRDRFRFGALQGDAARGELARRDMTTDTTTEMTTFYVVQGEQVLEKSDAWLAVVKQLQNPWPILAVCRVIPRGIRDRIYDFIGANRYRWFGRKDSCPLPDPDLAHKFLESSARNDSN